MESRNIFFSIVFIAVMAVSSSVFAYGSGSFVDDYKISPKENFVPGNDFRSSWEITYGDSKRPVQVLLKEIKGGEEYIVRTSYFEVRYVNSSKGFGVRALKPAEQIVPSDLNSKVLNANMFNNQKVISPDKVANSQVLDLIASYLPELINDEYKNILD